jgi:hypothetical protein
MMDQKQHENVEYFNSLGNVITNDAISQRKLNEKWVKISFKKKNLFTGKFELNLREKIVKCCI